jgi:hypothetical protein
VARRGRESSIGLAGLTARADQRKFADCRHGAKPPVPPQAHRFVVGRTTSSRSDKLASCFYARRNSTWVEGTPGSTMNESVCRGSTISLCRVGTASRRSKVATERGGNSFPGGNKISFPAGWERVFLREGEHSFPAHTSRMGAVGQLGPAGRKPWPGATEHFSVNREPSRFAPQLLSEGLGSVRQLRKWTKVNP